MIMYSQFRLHIDYAGPFLGKMFSVIIDAFSKWFDVQVVNAATPRVQILDSWWEESTFAPL